VDAHILNPYRDLVFNHGKSFVQHGLAKSTRIGNQRPAYMGKGQGILQINFGGAQMETPL
jgi:hypothetical protein